MVSEHKSRYRGRFAPSPTGALHMGSLLAALVSWLQARASSGVWLLRIDDIDPPREVPGSAEQIIATLSAFGMESDEPVLYQSRRGDAYDAALRQLRESGLLFECRCSRRDLEPTGVHPPSCQSSAANRQRSPALRIRVNSEPVEFVDALQGPVSMRLDQQGGPFVLRRVDGLYAYQLAAAVDDAWQGVTEVVRGQDLLDSTPRQIWLQRCLGLPRPDYLHIPVLLDGLGQKLSKQSAARPVSAADPLPALDHALRLIGLAEVCTGRASVSQRLQSALRLWHPERLPRCSSFPTPLHESAPRDASR